MGGRHGAGYLPAELSSFVDRRQEQTEVRELLGRGRVVTVTGVGGVGKTRLALRVAEAVHRTFPDGVWFVELAAVTDPSLVAETVAGTLDVPEQAGRSPAEALAAFVRERELLLVLDNCEHVLTGGSPLVTGLLRRAPGLRVLATSREVLGVPGEMLYPVSPFPVPAATSTHGLDEASSAAMALLLDRARASMQSFEVDAENAGPLMDICRWVDGLPLALELAAAQLRILSPQELIAMLRARPARLLSRPDGRGPRRTLRQTVEWSYDLCTVSERRLWLHLTVFAGHISLDAAEAVCAGDGLTADDVVEALQGLVNKSVLMAEEHAGQRAFRMLSVLREYGRELLHDEQSGSERAVEDELRLRHLRWYAGLADGFAREWFGPDQRDWLRRVSAALPDVRAALAFALEQPEHIGLGQRLAADLCQFWNAGPGREGATWLAKLVEADPAPSNARVRALSALSWVSGLHGSLPASAAAALAAKDLVDDYAPEWAPRVGLNVGALAAQRGDATGLRILEESLGVAERDYGEQSEEAAYACLFLGIALGMFGQADRAAQTFAQGAAICRAAGETWMLSYTLNSAAFLAELQGQRDRADAALQEALISASQVPDRHLWATVLNQFAVAEAGRNPLVAAYLFGVCESHWSDAGRSVFSIEPWATMAEQAQQRCRTALGDGAFEAERARGQGQLLEDGLAVAGGEPPEAPASAETHGTPTTSLTRREIEIAGLVAEGLTNKEIAERLVLSTRTVETHVQNILVKVGFHARSQIAAWMGHQTGGS